MTGRSCTNCGAEVLGGMGFCNNCGMPASEGEIRQEASPREAPTRQPPSPLAPPPAWEAALGGSPAGPPAGRRGSSAGMSDRLGIPLGLPASLPPGQPPPLPSTTSPTAERPPISAAGPRWGGGPPRSPIVLGGGLL